MLTVPKIGTVSIFYLTYANGVTLNLSYNAKGLEKERKYTQGTQTLYSMSTAYDAEGNILTETILRNNAQLIKNYTYDSLNRLTDENSSSRNDFWRYDTRHNLAFTNQNGFREVRKTIKNKGIKGTVLFFS